MLPDPGARAHSQNAVWWAQATPTERWNIRWGTAALESERANSPWGPCSVKAQRYWAAPGSAAVENWVYRHEWGLGEPDRGARGSSSNHILKGTLEN